MDDGADVNARGYFDRAGQPIPASRYATLFEDRDYARVALTRVGELEVSTVWLGLDHQWGDGPPMIFETLVFECVGGVRGLSTESTDGMWRYTSEADALAGHARVVRALSSRVRN